MLALPWRGYEFLLNLSEKGLIISILPIMPPPPLLHALSCRISLLDYQSFTADQLSILLEYLPTPTELLLLQTHLKSHPDIPLSNYQISNRYMLIMSSSHLPLISNYLQVMRYIHLSATQLLAIHSSLSSFQTICSEFLANQNLKLFFQFILRVANAINTIPLVEEKEKEHHEGDGERDPSLLLKGFRLESLLKLRTIKSNKIEQPPSSSFASSAEEEGGSPRGGPGPGKTISLLFYLLQSLGRRQLNYFEFFEEMTFFKSSLSSVTGGGSGGGGLPKDVILENLTSEFHEIEKEYLEKKKMFEEIVQSQSRPQDGEGEEGERRNGEQHWDEMKRGRDHVEKYFVEVCPHPSLPSIELTHPPLPTG
jgi:hypothetical protein